jgi:hypothetical protein
MSDGIQEMKKATRIINNIIQNNPFIISKENSIKLSDEFRQYDLPSH